MGDTQIIIDAGTPEMEGAYADFTKFCRDFDVSASMVMNSIMPKLLFCLRNYTRTDIKGNPIVTLNLGETVILTRENRRKLRRKQRRWDSAL